MPGPKPKVESPKPLCLHSRPIVALVDKRLLHVARLADRRVEPLEILLRVFTIARIHAGNAVEDLHDLRLELVELLEEGLKFRLGPARPAIDAVANRCDVE